MFKLMCNNSLFLIMFPCIAQLEWLHRNSSISIITVSNRNRFIVIIVRIDIWNFGAGVGSIDTISWYSRRNECGKHPLHIWIYFSTHICTHITQQFIKISDCVIPFWCCYKHLILWPVQRIRKQRNETSCKCMSIEWKQFESFTDLQFLPLFWILIYLQEKNQRMWCPGCLLISAHAILLEHHPMVLQ